MTIQNRNDQLLVNLLSASVMRHNTLTNNLVNQNTPNYQRETVRFEELLAAELHDPDSDPLSVVPELQVDDLTPAGADGNNVNPELEINGLLQNRLQYETYSTILAGRFELLRTAIAGGR